GRHRGGVGSVLRLRVDTTEDGVANTAGDGTRHPSYGILGGADGLPHRYRLLSRGRAPRTLKTKEVGIPVRPGDVFFVESAGGRTVAFGEVRVTDDAGALVAVGRATYLILPSRAREASG